MKRIAYVDGEGLKIWTPAEAFEIKEGESDEAWIERVRARALPDDATSACVLTEDQIPNNRHFRRAWRLADGRVIVDMPAAREVHRKRLRLMREPRLTALDGKWMAAERSGNAELKASIDAEKQRLLDVTADPAIEAAQTPDELMAAWPDWLERPR